LALLRAMGLGVGALLAAVACLEAFDLRRAALEMPLLRGRAAPGAAQLAGRSIGGAQRAGVAAALALGDLSWGASRVRVLTCRRRLWGDHGAAGRSAARPRSHVRLLIPLASARAGPFGGLAVEAAGRLRARIRRRATVKAALEFPGLPRPLNGVRRGRRTGRRCRYRASAVQTAGRPVVLVELGPVASCTTRGHLVGARSVGRPGRYATRGASRVCRRALERRTCSAPGYVRASDALVRVAGHLGSPT
jgi:hypothetical protein